LASFGPRPSTTETDRVLCENTASDSAATKQTRPTGLATLQVFQQSAGVFSGDRQGWRIPMVSSPS